MSLTFPLWILSSCHLDFVSLFHMLTMLHLLLVIDIETKYKMIVRYTFVLY